MTLASDGNAASTIVQGGVTSMMVVYFNSALNLMLPFFILTFILVAVDLVFGIEASRKRYAREHQSDDRVRPSKAIRRTVNKVFEYTCWTILSATLAVTFDAEWINILVMGIVVANEFVSVLDNYLYCHGKKITGLWTVIMRVLGKKIDTDLEGLEITDIDDDKK